MFFPLTLTIAAAWLMNVPAAIILSYTVVLLLAVMIIFRRNSRVYLYGVGAMALGVALAAFYIVPVLYEKNWITWGQLLSAGVRPNENFLFARTGDIEHDRFLSQLSWLATGELIVTALAIFVARSWRSSRTKLWWSLLMLAAMSLVLMLPVMALAYRLMPDMRFVQFPWRWLLITGAAYAVFVVTALPAFGGKSWAYALVFVVLIVGTNLALQPRCDPEDTPFMIANVYRTGYGYMGTDEYVPAGGDNYEIKPDFPEFRLRSEDGSVVPSGAQGMVLQWSIYRKQLAVDSPQSVHAVLRLMNYPAWRVTVNGRQVIAQSDDPTGRMVISLPAGHSDIEVQFIRTPDRWLGDGISVAALTFAGFWYVGRRKTQ
jgi:hypothetical protein